MVKATTTPADDWQALRCAAKALRVGVFKSDPADDHPPRMFVILNGTVQQLADQAAVRRWLDDVAEIPESRRGLNAPGAVLRSKTP